MRANPSTERPWGRALPAALALTLAAAAQAAAFEQPKSWPEPVASEELMLSLGEVARAFGPHAVVFQAALLNEAVRNGSLLEARVEAPVYEKRDGRKYVIFSLQSGIVYNDNHVSAGERIRVGWKEIVAAALRRLSELELKAEGLGVRVGYHHRPYTDERSLREELPDGRGEAEEISFFLGIEDAAGVANGTTTPDAALGRVEIRRDGGLVELR
jgi:hypothetical protein